MTDFSDDIKFIDSVEDFYDCQIDIDNNIIYKKIQNLFPDVEKIKEYIKQISNVDVENEKDFDQINTYLYSVVIQFLKNNNRMDDSLYNTLSNYGIFDHENPEQRNASIANASYAVTNIFKEDNKELVKQFIVDVSTNNPEINDRSIMTNGFYYAITGYCDSCFNDVDSELNEEEIKNNVFSLVKEFIENVKENNNVKDIDSIIQNIITGFTDSCLVNEYDVLIVLNIISKELFNEENKNFISNIIKGFTDSCLAHKYDVSIVLDIISKELFNEENKNFISNIMDGFYSGSIDCTANEDIDIDFCDLHDEKFVEKIYNFIEKKDYTKQIIEGITKGFIHGYNFEEDYSERLNDLEFFVIRCIEEYEYKDEVVIDIVKGFVLAESEILDKEQKSYFRQKVFEIITEKSKLTEIITKGIIQGYIEQGKDSSELGVIVNELIEKNPELTYNIIKGIIQGYIEQGKDSSELGVIVNELIEKNPELTYNIIKGITALKDYRGLVISEMIKNDPTKNYSIIATAIENIPHNEFNKFIGDLVKNSKDKNVYDVLFDTILCCVFDCKPVLSLINDIEISNDKKLEFKKVACAMLISNFLLNQQNNEYVFINENNEFIKVVNEIFSSRNSKINSIKDLTLNEIKTLFNDLMMLKFNKTSDGVNGNDISVGPFIQIFNSVANVCNIDNDKTIGEVLKNDEFNKKMSNFLYFDTNKIYNYSYNLISYPKSELSKSMGLKKENFGKPGFKIINVYLHGHVVALAIDTSKSWEEFIKEEPKPYSDIVLIDSSHVVKRYINGDITDNDIVLITNAGFKKFFSNVPTINNFYQKNGTCWANAASACSVILNNCETFDDIVENGKLKSDLESKIVEELNKYYLNNTDKIKEEKNYVVAGETKDGTLVKINLEEKYLFQRYNWLIENLERLKSDEKSLEQIKEKYKKEYGIDLVFEKSNRKNISYKPFDSLIKNFKYGATAGKKTGVTLNLEGIKGFKCCFGTSKNLHDIAISITFPDKNIKDIDDEFLKDLEDKIKNNGFDEKALNCQIKCKIFVSKDFNNESVNQDHEFNYKNIVDIGQMFANDLKNKEKEPEQPESIDGKFEEKNTLKPENFKKENRLHQQEPKSCFEYNQNTHSVFLTETSKQKLKDNEINDEEIKIVEDFLSDNYKQNENSTVLKSINRNGFKEDEKLKLNKERIKIINECLDFGKEQEVGIGGK